MITIIVQPGTGLMSGKKGWEAVLDGEPICFRDSKDAVIAWVKSNFPNAKIVE